MKITEIFDLISQGLLPLTWQNVVMILAGLILIYLSIKKRYEPVLLLPIGFGCILANLGMAATPDGDNFLSVLYRAGIQTELFPLLIFIGVGGMIDFSPLLSQPYLALLGAAGQFGIFGVFILASALGFSLNESASIGVIGAIDGPTAVYVAGRLAPKLLAPIAVAAYSYMSLIPIIQPPIMKLLTTRKERLIRMDYSPVPISKQARIIFPIVVTIAISILTPSAAPLIAALMLGNLLKESGVVERLNLAAQNEIINISTLFLGLTIGATMTARSFFNLDTLLILGLGLLAFILDTVMGLLFGKLMAWITGGKINPLIGACGISAFPMAGRLSAKMAQNEDFENFILMHAMGANTAGQLGSVIAGGLLLTLVLSLG
jgi:oxaloacetate decarboxylase beta subunit